MLKLVFPTAAVGLPTVCARVSIKKLRGKPVQVASQPCGFTLRACEAGNLARRDAEREGRTNSAPPQFGHLPFSVSSAQAAQKVHSKEQIRASAPEGSRSLSQHSQLGRISSMAGRYRPQELWPIPRINAKPRRPIPPPERFAWVRTISTGRAALPLAGA